MTNQFAQPFQDLVGIGGFDYFTAGTQPSEKGVVPAQRNTLRLYDDPRDRGTNIGRGEIVINDFSLQGFNHPAGDFSRHSNGFAWATMCTSRPGELVPAPLGSNTTASASGNYVGFHSAYAFSTLFLGIGSAANKSLWKQTSATDPTPTAITYSPAAEICSLSTTLASGAQRLAAGHVGQPVKLFSDAAGTVASTMHSSTNSCWGIIMSGVNATTPGVPVLLMYCGTTIGTKASDADMTTAITTTQTGVNAGGFAIGAVKAAGRAQRAYWGIPRVSNTSGALKYGAEAVMDVWSTDMTGNDLQPHSFTYLPDGILGAVPFRDGLLMHDGSHVVYWDGDDEYDLNIFRERSAWYDGGFPRTTSYIDSDERRKVRSLIVNGPECGVVWRMTDANGSGLDAHIELYNFEAGSWHNAGMVYFTAGTGTASDPDIVLTARGGAPLSKDTRYLYCFDQSTSTRFAYGFLPRAAESLLWQGSLGNGGTFTTDMPTYSQGTIAGSLLGCSWWLDAVLPGALPGTKSIKRAPKVITEVEFDGNLSYGGSDGWQFQVQVFGLGIDGTTNLTAYDQTFREGKPSADYIRANPQRPRSNITNVQVYLRATTVSGSNLQKIPLLLPLTIRFAYSKDGRVISTLPEDSRP